jgi:FkbM family methyltransferase
MKKIEGIWLPEKDTHFEYHLKANPQFKGAATYQWTKLKAALEIIPENRRRYAVDVGAHVGLWSRVLAYKFDFVWSFEPLPELQECFYKNVDLSNVTLYQFALGRESGIAFMSTEDDNSGNSRIDRTGDQSVRVLRFDDYKIDHLDFLKIDTEGTELDVIIGSRETIALHKPFILVEQKPGHAERYGYGKTEAVTYLQNMGAKLLWAKSGDYFLGWDE